MIAGALALAFIMSLEVGIAMPPRPDQVVVATDPDEVVVNGALVRRLKLKVRSRGKPPVIECALKRSSGDPALDAQVCDDARACVAQSHKVRAIEACLGPRLVAIRERRSRGLPIRTLP